ncbi:MAG: NUDIX domain-containing protein [Bacillota bacterium]
MNNWHKHIGVYGLAINIDNKILVINKVNGPYRKRYDVPGGTLNKDESIKECLIREFMEETGYSILKMKTCGVYDFLVNTPYGNCEYTHHIAFFYFVDVISVVGEVEKYVGADNDIETNDSESAEWIDLRSICYENASPLLCKAKNVLDGVENGFEISLELDWKVMDK